ncbi:hypothetical protein KDU71_07650 [Carboxylicivirga sediminis]|uniref:Uncharacterized protein n=1 Tax=Carboxylicivirga sediminis TaxID=2006564 RepID=A0A941F287_9BACT|nr:hypothetical protein [Carboxylicivirga sediminis]MBR8535431.1 hypothetical protein [Carboxylicivirga sediminis]
MNTNDNLLERFFIDREHRYKEFARHESRNADIEDHWEDVYMEVMTSFFGDKRSLAIELIKKEADLTIAKNKRMATFYKRNGNRFPLCEFDFYFISCLKLNIISPRAPYKWKYLRQPPTDANADYSRIELEDNEYEEGHDASEWIIEHTELIRAELDKLGIGELGQRVFAFKFFDGNSLNDWAGDEPIKEIRRLYAETLRLLRTKFNSDYLNSLEAVQGSLF